MNSDKFHFIKHYFEKWQKDIAKVEVLFNSNEYFVEGIIVAAFYIGAFARLRYQNETDLKSYKKIITEYSGNDHVFRKIDLLFLYQWPSSNLSQDKTYKCLKNHKEITELIQQNFGDEASIQNSAARYQDRETMLNIIKSKNPQWFDENNFSKYIELFSNTQIFYLYVRCEAVHNAYFPLFSEAFTPSTNISHYVDNHLISRDIILSTLKNIAQRLEAECCQSVAWPNEL